MLNANTFYFLLFTFYFLLATVESEVARSQPITPARDGTNTRVIRRRNNQFNIRGGQLSEDGANLFHSFEKFGLRKGQIANFLSNPNIQNILGRVTGGDASIINGLIQVTGGNSHLFLLNPAGFIFGANAQINVPGSFFYTRATAVGFDNNTWFNAVGENNWSELVGTPNKLRFEIGDLGNFPRLENLAIADGESLTIAAPQGDISVQTIPQNKLIRISRTGHILSLEIPLQDSSFTPNSPVPVALSLPSLITGGNGGNANQINVNRSGELILTGSGIPQREQNIDLFNFPSLEPRIPASLDNRQNLGEFVTSDAENILTVNETESEQFILNPGLMQLSQQQTDTGELNPSIVNEQARPNIVTQSTINNPLNLSQLEKGNPDRKDEVGGDIFTGNSFTTEVSGEAIADRPPPNSRGEFSSPDSSINLPSIVTQSTINHRPNTTQLESGILQIENRWSQQFSNYLQADVPQIKSATSIREMLGKIENKTGQRPAIIYAIAEPEQLTLMAIAANQSFVKSIQVNRQELLRTAKEFRAFVSTPRNNFYQKTARKLYNLLIEPLEKDLETLGINTLIFSLDAGLRAIPLAALLDGETFLVEKYNLSLIPSVSLTDASYKGLENAQLLAMGASEFAEQDSLLAVPVELSTITSIWGESQTFFLNQDFTFNNLKAKRHQHQIVHLATHANFRSDEQSYIQLADRKLKLEQLRELKWYESPTVELLVLSACRTAIGDAEMEMGFAGLSVQAGVKSALASLWFVSDEGTLALMAQFYQMLRETPIKATALQQAQIAMLRGEVRFESGKLYGRRSPNKVRLPPELANLSDRNIDLSHPFYWAGFTLIGSPW